MTDFSRAWPFGLNGPRWWISAGIALALLVLALMADRAVSVWAQGWPPQAVEFLRVATRYGESDWILIPTAVLFLLIWGLHFLVRWKLMRLMLLEQAWLFAFIFCGVGLPSLISTIAKRAIGRGRPMHFDEVSILGFRPNLLAWDYQSFPSGHATTAFALAACIGFLSVRWFWPAVAFALVIGVSRVALGLHYPSDVLGGAILGLLGAYFARVVFSGRGMLFRRDPEGLIRHRPLTALRRYMKLKTRRSAPALR
ncbi:MAG TPA: phosphatase PAP2 family protein [Devosia sp.]|nr:phosphatase PAP2 family protein [Devosia sp.]